MTEPASDSAWYVYLLECSDGSYYCGVAKDVDARVTIHNEGKGAKYTRGRTPVVVVATSPPMSRADALRLEMRVKRVERTEKPVRVRAGA